MCFFKKVAQARILKLSLAPAYATKYFHFVYICYSGVFKKQSVVAVVSG